MGKQTIDRTKKILGISMLVFFVISMTVAAVGAAPPDGSGAASGSGEKGLAPGYGSGHGNDGNSGNCSICQLEADRKTNSLEIGSK
jgi:hypothetical protein